ncbi:hypothetical protein O3G_MSEX001965 [Manduca sexta]|uniref:Uncharacterized protein n=1 Tax=Manduca sexta TaxID=7130 RepID=A0A921YLU5_MANSE|nr:hypothetical protein O3G_MSEX001965 [Manduca sexta]
MTSDKPGTVIPLAGDKTSTPVDSNVTVLSWGHLKGDLFSGQKHKKKKPKNEVEKCSSESGEHFHNNNFPGTQGIPEALRAGKPVSSSEEVTPEYHRPKKHSKKKKRALRTSTRSYKTRFRTIKQSLIQKYQIDLNEYRERSNHLISRYLTQKEQGNLTKKLDDKHLHEELESKNDTTKKDYAGINMNRNITKEKTEEESQNIKLQYKNWRRKMGPQQNKLTVEVFGFVNMQTCKKVVENAMPEIYEIKGVTDIVCYASDEHLITAEDSGAPAIRHGQLVAVTVGGAECDGDHVAVGMKMSCYCSWIAANLPPGGPRLQCCKNCCDVSHDDHSHKNSPPRHRNKYLL